MKKQNNNMKTTEVKVRKQRKFFLYVDGKGFIRLDEHVGAMPSFDKGEILTFNSRASAVYAREFFVNIKFAESIDILSKVA